jgi:opacity protein-like surface antigen
MSRVTSIVVRSACLTLALSGAIGVARASDSTDVGSINFTLGYKNLDSEWNLNQRLDGQGRPTDAWTVADSMPKERVYQPALGVETTWGRKSWPVQIAFDILNSADDGISHMPPVFTTPAYDLRLKAHTLELGLGARRAFDLKFLTPYVGAGGLWVRGKVAIEVSDPNSGQFGTPTASAHMSNSAFGYWFAGGVTRRLGPQLQMGLAYRFSKATLPAQAFTVDSGSLPPGMTTFPEADGGGRTIHLVVGWSFPSH